MKSYSDEEVENEKSSLKVDYSDVDDYQTTCKDYLEEEDNERNQFSDEEILTQLKIIERLDINKYVDLQIVQQQNSPHKRLTKIFLPRMRANPKHDPLLLLMSYYLIIISLLFLY